MFGVGVNSSREMYCYGCIGRRLELGLWNLEICQDDSIEHVRVDERIE